VENVFSGTSSDDLISLYRLKALIIRKKKTQKPICKDKKNIKFNPRFLNFQMCLEVDLSLVNSYICSELKFYVTLIYLLTHSY